MRYGQTTAAAAFARAVFAASLITALAACESGDRAPPAGGGTPSESSAAGGGATPAPAGACLPPRAGPVDSGSVLVPGPTNGLSASPAQGQKLVIVALVLDSTCAPVEGANLNIWHTDAEGRYGPAGTERCCYYGGTVRTDRDGRFRMDTIRPAQYPEPGAPPAHIHLEIRHTSGHLDTEIIFTETPGPTIPARPSTIVPVYLSSSGTGDDTSWYGEVTFVLE